MLFLVPYAISWCVTRFSPGTMACMHQSHASRLRSARSLGNLVEVRALGGTLFSGFDVISVSKTHALLTSATMDTNDDPPLRIPLAAIVSVEVLS